MLLDTVCSVIIGLGFRVRFFSVFNRAELGFFARYGQSNGISSFLHSLRGNTMELVCLT